MSNNFTVIDEQTRQLLTSVASDGVKNAARGMSEMLGEKVMASEPTIQFVPFSHIVDIFGGPENEAVGVYLRAEMQLAGQIMIVIPYTNALELVDLMMGEPAGTTSTLGSMESSALAELGNLTTSFFLNAIAERTHLDVRPTPPAVMVDMVGAILQILVASWDNPGENIVMIQTSFMRREKSTHIDFCVLPDWSTLEFINRRETDRDVK